MIWKLYDLIKSAKETQKEINGRYVPARPIVDGFFERLHSAIFVLLGRADAFVWPEKQ